MPAGLPPPTPPPLPEDPGPFASTRLKSPLAADTSVLLGEALLDDVFRPDTEEDFKDFEEEEELIGFTGA